MAIAHVLALIGALGAEPERPSIELVVKAESPLRIALDDRVRLRRAGQPIAGTLLAPVYAYDRVVVPAGTRVLGRVSKLEKVRGGRRLRAMASGDFTPLRDSARTLRGSLVQAVVTEPLFSEDHRLILPEGTVLTGEVTFARAARRFHRNGQLRFLFETVQAGPAGLQGSLYSVQGGDPRLALDDEGGARITHSKSRVAAPALAGLALGFSLHRRWDYDTDGLGPEAQYGTAESKGLGGFFGAGLIGAGLSQASRPMAVGFGVVELGTGQAPAR
jgi:hypothetical protein